MPEHEHRYVKEAIYHYTSAAGVILYRKVKKRCACGEKTFANQRKIGHAYVNGLGTMERVPYNLGPVADAVAEGHPIWVVEGEKDVETLRDLSEVATCSPDGARSWSDALARHLIGATEVRVVADTDTPGRRYAALVRRTLVGHVGRLTVCEPLSGKDVSDHVAAGHSLAELVSDAPMGTGIAAGLAPRFASANVRADDPRLPADTFPTPSSWARITHSPCQQTRDWITGALVVHEHQIVPPDAVPARCGGCQGFLMVETKSGAGRTCHRCRVTYETEAA